MAEQAAESKRWQPQGSQALVQNLPVNANAVRQQARVSLAQIRHESAAVSALQNPHTTHDGHSLILTQSPGRAFVNDHEIGPQRPGQEDGGEFSSTQRMSRAECRQIGRIGSGMAAEVGASLLLVSHDMQIAGQLQRMVSLTELNRAAV